MELPDLSNSMFVARLRYIQSIHEAPERRNPDSMVKYFLPFVARIRAAWIGQKALSTLREDPFYYFLVARTKYYDEVVTDALLEGVQRIVGVGCGTDTRAYRFRSLLNDKGVRVLECDQPEVIHTKARMVSRWGRFAPVEYTPIDLNDSQWPALHQWLGDKAASKTLVIMEGVSPYINAQTFLQFLRFLATTLLPGSQIAYDYKILGVRDDFGHGERSERLFRLPDSHDEVAIFHDELGLRLESLELSSELSARLLPTLVESAAPLFLEDALVRLRVTGA